MFLERIAIMDTDPQAVTAENHDYDWEEIAAYVVVLFAFRAPEGKARGIDVDDVRQETLGRVWKVLSETSPEDYPSWKGLVSRIASQKWIDALRAAQRRREHSLEALPTIPPAPITSVSQRVMRAEWYQQLCRDVAAWPSDERQLFRLRALEERTYEEIGEVLGDSKDAVKARWYRLRMRIKRRPWIRNFFTMDV